MPGIKEKSSVSIMAPLAIAAIIIVVVIVIGICVVVSLSAATPTPSGDTPAPAPAPSPAPIPDQSQNATYAIIKATWYQSNYSNNAFDATADVKKILDPNTGLISCPGGPFTHISVDPAPGKSKSLAIQYSKNGLNQTTFIWDESKGVNVGSIQLP